MVQLRSDMGVQLVDHMGSDQRICQAARVSTLGIESLETGEAGGLIRFLMKGRHSSPFEHGSLTFLVEAPIFVWREIVRHRIGVSLNEESARYRELAPIFYQPAASRKLVQIGRPGQYSFIAGTREQFRTVETATRLAYEVAWNSYQRMLSEGIAREVARIALPVAIYSAAYITFNPRSLLHFLSLRTIEPNSIFPSYPQREIEMVAEQMEEHFAVHFPLTHAAFREMGSAV